MTSVTEPGCAERILARRAAARAVADLLGVTPERLEIRSAPDGAPEVWLEDERAAVAVSLSHRHGRALAVAAPAGVRIGCDVERVAPRHPALGSRLGLEAGADDEQVTLAWSVREAIAKAERRPVRLDTPVEAVGAPWCVSWLRDGEFVEVVVSDDASSAPACVRGTSS